MAAQNHAYFQVAAKALLFDGDKLLALETPDGYIDFPGGRVDQSEIELPWAEILRRETAEELGPKVKFSVGKTLFVAKRSYTHSGADHHIAAIYFACEYHGGDIELSSEHGSYAWLEPAELTQTSLKFVSKDEKEQLQAHFATK